MEVVMTEPFEPDVRVLGPEHDECVEAFTLMRQQLLQVRSSRQAWAEEAMRLEVELERANAKAADYCRLYQDATDQLHRSIPLAGRPEMPAVSFSASRPVCAVRPEVEWQPGDPVHPEKPRRGHCSNSACGTTWTPPGADTCPECGSPAGEPIGEAATPRAEGGD
jgi:hypothetical protein